MSLYFNSLLTYLFSMKISYVHISTQSYGDTNLHMPVLDNKSI